MEIKIGDIYEVKPEWTPVLYDTYQRVVISKFMHIFANVEVIEVADMVGKYYLWTIPTFNTFYIKVE